VLCTISVRKVETKNRGKAVITGFKISRGGKSIIYKGFDRLIQGRAGIPRVKQKLSKDFTRKCVKRPKYIFI